MGRRVSADVVGCETLRHSLWKTRASPGPPVGGVLTEKNLDITPSVKIYDLLETFPELEDVLIGIAPPFKKLKNPILRRSVAKVATLKHIASVANVPLTELINRLRKSVGQADIEAIHDEVDYFQAQPDWYSAENVSVSIEEAALAGEDKLTLARVLTEAKNLKKGDIIELVTTFLPAPGIDILRSKGYSVWSVHKPDGVIKSYFLKNS